MAMDFISWLYLSDAHMIQKNRQEKMKLPFIRCWHSLNYVAKDLIIDKRKTNWQARRNGFKWIDNLLIVFQQTWLTAFSDSIIQSEKHLSSSQSWINVSSDLAHWAAKLKTWLTWSFYWWSLLLESFCSAGGLKEEFDIRGVHLLAFSWEVRREDWYPSLRNEWYQSSHLSIKGFPFEYS